MLLDKINELDLAVNNLGDVPTYRKGETASRIDITLSSTNITGNINGWRVDDTLENLSDHNNIFFDIYCDLQEDIPQENKTTRKWKVTPNELAELGNKAKMLSYKEDNNRQEKLTEEITNLCENSLKKSKKINGKSAVYWWNDEIAKCRKECITARRKLTRENGRENVTEDIRNAIRADYNIKKKQLKYLILQSKKRSWDKLLEEVDADIWGLGYKIVTKKLRRKRPILDEQTIRQQIERLFPTYPVEHRRTIIEIEQTENFTEEEVMSAIQKAKTGKAPGIDGIPAEVIKMIAVSNITYLTESYNVQWKNGNFPDSWKRAKLLLIEKPRRDNEPTTYRPLCLLSCIGKVYERLINDRLMDEIDNGEGLYKWQYGFRKRKSTTDAINRVSHIADEVNSVSYTVRGFCVMVTLDIKNAFNSIKWSTILDEISRRGISCRIQKVIQNYLSNRNIETDNNINFYATCGVPQGSVLGPTLWNIAYDKILKQEVPEDVSMVAFADDLAIIVQGKNADTIKSKIKQTIEITKIQLEQLGLRLADEKAKTVILAGRQKLQHISIQIDNGMNINSQQTINYLGVCIQKDNLMTRHVIQTVKKADKQIVALTRLIPNLKGPKTSKRRIYGKVLESTMLYAAPAGKKAWRIKKYEGMIEKRNRMMAVRVLCGYRTISLEAAIVLAVMPPIKLLAEERINVYEGMTKTTARLITIEKWQERWSNTKEGWTKQLIPNLRKWINRDISKMPLNHFSTQILTGHGVFNAYRLRIRKTENEQCWYCDAIKDDPEHTMFICRKWDQERATLEEEIETVLTVENLIETMLNSENNWEKITNFMSAIMKEKAEEERRMERTNNEG